MEWGGWSLEERCEATGADGELLPPRGRLLNSPAAQAHAALPARRPPSHLALSRLLTDSVLPLLQSALQAVAGMIILNLILPLPQQNP